MCYVVGVTKPKLLDDEELQMISIKLPKRGIRLIEDEARRRRITRSAQIREMLGYAVIHMPKREPTEL